MRKGRGHDDRTEKQSKRSQERGGNKVVVMAVTMTTATTITTMEPQSDLGCGGGEWQASATTVVVAMRMRGCFGNITRHPL